MKRLFFVVEGQTEEEFVNQIIAPYFRGKGIYDVRATMISTSKGHKGGFVNYAHLKNDILRLLKEKEVVVTTFVDFFRLPNSIPKYNILSKIRDKNERVMKYETAIWSDIKDRRFIPYIQLHEFEALLFSSIKGFQTYYESEKGVIKSLSNITKAFPNPEEINSTQPPSYRIKAIVPTYDKVVFGNTIALEIGIETMLKKCPKFKSWIAYLIQKCSEI